MAVKQQESSPENIVAPFCAKGDRPGRRFDVNLAAYPSFRNRSFSAVVSGECPSGIDNQQTAGLQNSHQQPYCLRLKHQRPFLHCKCDAGMAGHLARCPIYSVSNRLFGIGHQTYCFEVQ